MSGNQDSASGGNRRTAGGQQPPAQGQGAPQQNTGPSMTDAFSRPDTKTEIVLGVGIYAAIAVGMGFGAFGLKELFSSGSGSGLGSLMLAFVTFMTPFYIGPVLGGLLGLRHARVFADLDTSLVYGTTAGTGFLGTFGMFVVGFIVFAIASDGSGSSGGSSSDLGDLLVPVIIACIGAAIAAATVVWLLDRYEDSRSAQPAH